MAQPATGKFPYWIDAAAPHKAGHAKTIPTPPGSLVKVSCKCAVPAWITTESFQKTGRHSGKFCFICGPKRVEL